MNNNVGSVEVAAATTHRDPKSLLEAAALGVSYAVKKRCRVFSIIICTLSDIHYMYILYIYYLHKCYIFITCTYYIYILHAHMSSYNYYIVTYMSLLIKQKNYNIR